MLFVSCATFVFSSKPEEERAVCLLSQIRCSAAERQSAVNLLQMLVKTSEERFPLVMCQGKKESNAELNILVTLQQEVELDEEYIEAILYA